LIHLLGEATEILGEYPVFKLPDEEQLSLQCGADTFEKIFVPRVS